MMNKRYRDFRRDRGLSGGESLLRRIPLEWRFVAMLCCVALILLSVAMLLPDPQREAVASATPEPAGPDATDPPAAVDEPAASPAAFALPQTLAFYRSDTGQTEQMAAEEYLVGVLSAEMPVLYEMEALKAQAVAARTYLAYKMGHGGCATHPGADICDRFDCCQAWDDWPAQQDKWGQDAQTYRDKLTQAVSATAGEVVVDPGQPIEALFHSMSGGRTENAEHVFSSAQPYLVGVDSPGEQEQPQYLRTKSFANAAFVQALNAAFPEAGLTEENLAAQFGDVARYESGRVERLRVGRATVTGVQFRAALNLASANFSLSFEGDKVVVTTRGSGHGVGMSQVGANLLAAQGAGYRDILEHYYTGVEIVNAAPNP